MSDIALGPRPIAQMADLLPLPPSRSRQLAEHLVRDEAARPELAGIVADLMCDRLRWPDGGGPAIVLGTDGQPATSLTVADLIAQARRAMPECFAGPIQPRAAAPSTGPKFAPGTRTAQAIAFDAARKAGKSKADNTAPNPWAAATHNLTQQVLLEARDPARAARLKAEAAR